MTKWLAVLTAALVAIGSVRAAEVDDPKLEERVMRLSSELRCLVCQNQSLADSNAELATDLRQQVREKMKQGMSEREIVDYMVARYGDFVLYRPPLKATTLLLWFGPLMLLLAGLGALFYRLARRPAAPEIELSASDRARAAALLGSNDAPDRK